MKRILTIAGLAALSACASGTAGSEPATGPGTVAVTPPATGVSAASSGAAVTAAATITAEDMRRHVAYLARDALRGRDTPSPGLDSAAAYLAREFAGLGLQPGAGGGRLHPALSVAAPAGSAGAERGRHLARQRSHAANEYVVLPRTWTTWAWAGRTQRRQHLQRRGRRRVGHVGDDRGGGGVRGSARAAAPLADLHGGERGGEGAARVAVVLRASRRCRWRTSSRTSTWT